MSGRMNRSPSRIGEWLWTRCNLYPVLRSRDWQAWFVEKACGEQKGRKAAGTALDGACRGVRLRRRPLQVLVEIGCFQEGPTPSPVWCEARLLCNVACGNARCALLSKEVTGSCH